MNFTEQQWQKQWEIVDLALANDGGAPLSKAVHFFSEFVHEVREPGDADTKAVELGYHSFDHLEHQLFNLLFDFFHRCKQDGIVAELIHLIVHLDRFSVSLKDYFGRCLKVSDDEVPETVKLVISKILNEFYEGSVGMYVTEYDIAYAGTDHPRQALDVHRPSSEAEKKKLPAILYFHGGAWAYGDRQSAIKRFRHYNEAGVVLISASYRLIPDAIWPDPMDDCVVALDYVIEHADALGIDASKIAVWGSSAGAHLAGLLAGGERGAQADKIRGYIDFCAPVALDEYVSVLTGAMREVSPVMQLLGGDHDQLKKWAHDASINHTIDATFPPTLIVHGTADDTVPFAESEMLQAKIRAAGGKATLVTQLDGLHRVDDTEVADQVVSFIRDIMA